MSVVRKVATGRKDRRPPGHFSQDAAKINAKAPNKETRDKTCKRNAIDE
ncbi:hypothetical protein MY11210_007777 [Beauveria gryllotalpidicola]